MVKEADTKINRVGPRHTIYLQKDLVEDSTFPFGLNEALTVRVEGERLVIERAKRRTLAPDFIPGSEDQVVAGDLLESLGYAPILSRAEKIYEMLKEVHEAETLDLRVKHIPQGEHALLLWRDRRLLDHVLSEFFDSEVTEGSPKGILSEKPYMNAPGADNRLYSQVFSKDQNGREESLAENILGWLGRVQASTKTSRTGARVAVEDYSWFIQNGFQDEVGKVEEGIGLHPERGMSVLCSYDMSQMTDSETVNRILLAHSYVIIDSPFRVYRRKKPEE